MLKPKIAATRKRKLLMPYMGTRAYGRLIMVWVGIMTIAVFWDLVTKIIKF